MSAKDDEIKILRDRIIELERVAAIREYMSGSDAYDDGYKRGQREGYSDGYDAADMDWN